MHQIYEFTSHAGFSKNPFASEAGMKRLNRDSSWKGGRGEEVLERDLLSLSKGPQRIITAAFTVEGGRPESNVRILKFLRPDRPFSITCSIPQEAR